MGQGDDKGRVNGYNRRPMRRLLVLTAAAVVLMAAAPSEGPDARARALIEQSRGSTTAWERLRELTDTIGARLAGSDAEPRAVAWARDQFARDGLTARLEPVLVPVWKRGRESGAIVHPVSQPLALLGLGGTVPTPPEGIEAAIVVVSSFDEMKGLGASAIGGRIVVYDVPWVRGGDEFSEYGKLAAYRTKGASEAARLGAAAVLVRSVGTASLRTPHTGAMRYEADAPKIPAAAVSVEDAALLRRLAAGREVRVRLSLESSQEPDRPGSNVVAEIRGREHPEEIVAIGAHLDSWDVGTGAVDDGSGCAMVLETMRFLAAGSPPRRTVRAILFANEENGLRGGRAYREEHEAEMDRHVAVLEADSGGARAVGLSVRAGEGGVDLLRAMMEPVLSAAEATRFRAPGGGADFSPLGRHGVPRLSLDVVSTHYFDWHHTMADTLDKVDPADLQHAASVLAAATWILAEDPRALPRYTPSEEELRPSPPGTPPARPAPR